MSERKGWDPLGGRANVSGLGGRRVDPCWDRGIWIIRIGVLVISHDLEREGDGLKSAKSSGGRQ